MFTPAIDAGAVQAPVAPTAPVGEPAQAAEPAAAEPAAAPEPAVEAEAASSFASADEFGWDDWDGVGDNLPEEVRGWYSKFDERNKTATSQLESTHAEALRAAQQDAEQWQRIYNSMLNGEQVEDPRIAEHSQRADVAEAMLKQEREAMALERKAWKEHVEAEADTYFKWLEHTHGEILAKIPDDSPELELVNELYDAGFQYHEALQVFDLGPEAIESAKKMRADNVPPEYVLKMLAKQVTPAQVAAQAATETKSKPKPTHSPAADIVAGAQPARTPENVPKPAATGGRLGRLQAAAAAAVANERGRARH